MCERSESWSLIVLCVLVVCSPAVLRADSYEEISVRIGDEFTVALDSNPSTGYSWVLPDPLPRWLELVDKTFVPASPGLPGGSGTEVWTFRAATAGSTTLTFEYQRPWEGKAVNVHVCQITAAPPTETESIAVAAGEEFTVKLASNPSTGYSWVLPDPLPKWLELVDKTFVASDPGLLGGGGTEVWTFRATAAGNATLTFEYQRPWEGTAVKEHVCKVLAVSPSDMEKIVVTVGEQFTVKLASTPGTGYSWALVESLPGWLELINKTFVAASPGLPGGSGTDVWTFRATAAGSATLTFEYRRPWEDTAAQVHICKVLAVSPSDMEKIGVTVGEQFTVKLASNPSTGYSWVQTEPLPKWLELVDRTFVPASPGLPGGGGTDLWTFRATAAGSASLTFEYQRPWEDTAAQVHVCKVAATVPTDTENIAVAVGEQFTVKLASNPSTGYSWVLPAPLPKWLELVDKTFVPASSGLLGGGGAELWTFRVTAPGSATLTFEYQRPWEGKAVKVHVCRVTAKT